MSPAPLCELCKSIPFHNLPPFPDSSYNRTASGYKHLQSLIRTEGKDPVPARLGFHHHPNLESLRRAAAGGCELCRQIEIQVDGVLADIAHQDAKWAAFPDVRWPETDPTFDMWITKRGEGGDGFWVSTKSKSRPETFLFCLATFGLCAEDESPLASIFPGRPIVGPPDGSVLDRVASWVSACNSHENCTGDDLTLPTRLIDVGGPVPETMVTVVETEEGTRGAYTALSYCWGDVSNPYTTQRSLLNSRKSGMALSGLPRTFRDAITVTRRLGVRYIWIDSLCICQDDTKDWERESARMAAVYSNAYLTIAATGSSDSTGGLLFDRPERPYLRAEFKPTDTGAAGGDMLIFPLAKAKEVVRSLRVNMDDQPLAKRGWAFQERLLARRVLHFASDQISFECLKGTVLEEGLRIQYRYPHAHTNNGGEEEVMKLQRRYGEELKLGRDWRSPIGRWFCLLKMYGNRKLTFASDKLPALSGVAKVYANMLDDEYVAGIWRKTMIEGLCWQSLRCKPIEGYRAPSWSWASVDGMAAAGFFSNHREIGTVLDYHVDIDGDNPFGRVKDAWLEIKAPLVPLELSEKKGPTGFMCLKVVESDSEGSICGFDTIDKDYSASAELVRGMELYALVLAALYPRGKGPNANSDAEDVDWTYNCLLVTPVEGRDRGGSTVGALERVGWNFFGKEDFRPGQLDSSITTVTLV